MPLSSNADKLSYWQVTQITSNVIKTIALK